MASIPMVDTVTGPSMSELWKTRRDKTRYQWSSFGLLTPTFALLIFLFLVPMGYAVYLGFTNLTLVGPQAINSSFVPWAQLTRLRTDSSFWSSLQVTGIFIVGSIVGVVIVGYTLASLLMRAVPWLRIVV